METVISLKKPQRLLTIKVFMNAKELGDIILEKKPT